MPQEYRRERDGYGGDRIYEEVRYDRINDREYSTYRRDEMPMYDDREAVERDIRGDRNDRESVRESVERRDLH
jgi:hypothetical protein